MKETRRSIRLVRRGRMSGQSDVGMILMVIFAASAVSFTLMFLGWIKSMNHRRHGIVEVPEDQVDAYYEQQAQNPYAPR